MFVWYIYKQLMSGLRPAGAAFPGQEGSGDGIDYDDKDSGQRHKRGGVDDGDKQ
jgi:hypothetical protein